MPEVQRMPAPQDSLVPASAVLPIAGDGPTFGAKPTPRLALSQQEGLPAASPSPSAGWPQPSHASERRVGAPDGKFPARSTLPCDDWFVFDAALMFLVPLWARPSHVMKLGPIDLAGQAARGVLVRDRSVSDQPSMVRGSQPYRHPSGRHYAEPNQNVHRGIAHACGCS